VRKTISVSLEDYEAATQDYLGWCPECGDFTRDSTEPDAENYDCPECEQDIVVGAENAMIMGLIDIEF